MLSREEVTKLIEDAIEPAIEKAVDRSIATLLLRFGIDPGDPIQTQRDLAHLRSWRESCEAVRRQGLSAAMTTLVFGVIGAGAWLLRERFGWLLERH